MDVEIIMDESYDGGDVSVLTQSPSVLATVGNFQCDASSAGSLTTIAAQTQSLICRARAEVAEVEGGYDADVEDNLDEDNLDDDL